MLLTDIPALFENSYSIALDTQLMKIESIEPTLFLGQKGVRFTYSFALKDEEVRRKGEASATIVGGKLYLISFEAPELYYFDRDISGYRSLIAAAKLQAQ